MGKLPRSLLALALAAAAIAAVPAVAGATTYQVTTNADSNSGTCLPGACTLRQAVSAVNGGAGGDLIKLPPGPYALTFGQLPLLKPVTIEGSGAASTVIDAAGLSRVIDMNSSASPTRIVGLTVKGGKVAGTSAVQARGAGIFNSGTLTLEDVVIRGNSVVPANNTGTSPEGGGIWNGGGTLKAIRSTFEENTATSLPHTGGIPAGGAIFNSSGVVELVDSVLTRNTVSGDAIPGGGAIWSTAATAHGSDVSLLRTKVEGNFATNPSVGGFSNAAGLGAFRTDVTIVESSLSLNKTTGGAVADGGAIYVIREGDFVVERSLIASNLAEAKNVADGGGIMLNGESDDRHSIVNSTIVGNIAKADSGGVGGGIFHFGRVHLDIVSSTIAGNRAEGGKAGNLMDAGSEGSLTVLRDSIVAAGAGLPGFENCSSQGISSAGHNIDSLDQCKFTAAGDKVNTNPLLAPLAANGGPTETMALLAASPALDAGAECPPTDQRGVARPQGPGCDIGAFEVEVRPTPPQPPPLPAKLKFLSRKVLVDPATGKAKLRVRCLAAAGDRCKVDLKLMARVRVQARSSGKATFQTKAGWIKGTVAGGKAGKLRLKLKPVNVRFLAESGGVPRAMRVLGSSRNRAGERTKIDRKLKVGLKAKRR